MGGSCSSLEVLRLDLLQAWVYLSSRLDKLVWNDTFLEGSIKVFKAYKHIIQEKLTNTPSWGCLNIWKWNFPLRLFGWLVINNKILSWENLLKRDSRDQGFVFCAFHRKRPFLT